METSRLFSTRILLKIGALGIEAAIGQFNIWGDNRDIL
jgi:hypothetical protein